MQAFGWSIQDCDNADFETLIRFIAAPAKSGQRTIDGKVYTLAAQPPPWL